MNIKRAWEKHGATALTITSVVTGAAAVALSWWESDRCSKELVDAEEKKYEDYIGHNGPDSSEGYQGLTKKEQNIIRLKHAAVPIALEIISIACSFGSDKKNKLTQEHIASAAATALNYATMFEKKAEEHISSDKMAKIRKEVAEEIMENDPPKKITNQQYDDNLVWFRDYFSGQEFRSSVVDLERVKNKLNEAYLNGEWVCLNEYYILLGLEPIDAGWTMGWIVDFPVELINFHTDLIKLKDGTPCGLIVFDTQPKSKEKQKK